MMLSYLGWPAWEQRILSAIERVIAQGECLPRDQGGHATTREGGKAVAAALA
jgi:tartrate dehydrogenase/decarboxylase / D-malate dehydrogenase